LAPAWRAVCGRVQGRAPGPGIGPGAGLPPARPRPSPSALGFPNPPRTRNGGVRLPAFAYARRDRPAQAVAGFLCPVGGGVPAEYFPAVVEALAADLSEPDRFRARVALMLPVYRAKWCCIVLNEFVGVAGSRRRFAGADLEAKKGVQLQKARRILQQLTGEW